MVTPSPIHPQTLMVMMWSRVKILSCLSFNSFINKNIHVEGIKDVDEDDIINANKLGYKIKLMGFSEILNNKIFQRVHPTLVKKSSYIAGVNGVLSSNCRG